MKPRSLVEAPFVQLPPRVAALLEACLPLSELRQRVRGQDSGVDDVLLGIRVLAMTYTAERSPLTGSGFGTTVVKPPEPAVDWMTVRQVSETVDISDSAVRKAAREGRLRGDDSLGLWRFKRTDVALWAASRQHRRAA